MKLTALFIIISSLSSFGMLDRNSNGVSDIWEAKYNATELVSSAAMKLQDADDDGQTNMAEAEAGTNPRDPKSCLQIKSIAKTESSVNLMYPVEAGKVYQVFTNDNLSVQNNWNSHGSATLANQTTVQQSTVNSQSTEVRFYRIKVTDKDTDNDGLTDWEETQLPEADSTNPNSITPGMSDHDAISGNFQNLQNLTLTVDKVDAYEKEDTQSKITVSRNGFPSTQPMTFYFHITGATNPAKSSASKSDYVLKNAAGEEITKGFATIPAGSDTVDIFVHPVSDAKAEVPETLVLNISTTEKSITTRICDAAVTDANRKLFLAQLTPVAGTNSTGSGLGSLLLNGDNDVSAVNINFFGLSSSQNGAHLQYINNNSQTNLTALPGGQTMNAQYALRATQFLTTDQAILDALLSGLLAINIESKNHINGEIRGNLVPSEGYTEADFQAPAAPPAIPMLTGEALDRDIVRFLTQATFGPTKESIQEVKNLVSAHSGNQMAAYGAYIDTHLFGNPSATPAVSPISSPSLELMVHGLDAHQQYLNRIPNSPDFKADSEPRNRNRRRAWWTMAVYAPDQIRQKAAYALSQILVISEDEGVIGQRHYAMANYYDMLKTGVTGDFRTLIENVSKHPCMGQYLSALRNQKSNGVISPDENYAREIMQLFTIGLAQLHEDGSFKLSNTGAPIATYDQNDITALSRVFTGWSLAVYNSPNNSNTVLPNTLFNRNGGGRYYQQRFIAPMIQFPDYHDVDEKVIAGLGLTIPAGKTGQEELTLALDKLANHPNTAPFIVKRLIQRLVTSNPSNGYIYRVTQVWKNNNGNLAPVVKAILLDYEARAFAPTLASSYGKKREPLLQFVSIMRALDAHSKLPLDDTDDSESNNPANTMGQLTAHAYNPAKYAEFKTQFQALKTAYPAWGDAKLIRFSDIRSNLSQMALGSPSVFNFYLPGYSPSGELSTNGLLAPEFQLATEVNAVKNLNYYHAMIVNTSGIGTGALPNQNEEIQYNPYNYQKDDDHLIPNKNPVTNPYMKAYMDVMDTDNNGKVNELDTTFNKDEHIYAAVVAMVDKLDMNLTAGRLKAEYAAGFDYQNIRANNPRDQIIESTRLIYNYYDDDGDTDPNDGTDNVARDEGRQTIVLNERFEWAAYLISASPTGAIQK